MTQRKKLIEVALPLEAINEASAREKSIRHGHPSTLHLWWARRPLAAARAVIFTSLVDDPGHHPEDHDEPVNAPPAFIEACKALPKGKNATGVDEKGRSNDTPRMRLFDFIERLVTWEATTDEAILTTARELILLSTDGNPPPLLDPFAGGGSIPLEAQRLGLEAHASDLNPVAVMINKALIEIPPKFANQPPVNPRDRQGAPTSSGQTAAKMASVQWKGASGLAADVRYYGEWMREKAWERIGHLYPECNGETVIAWLWARTVKCPNPACGATIPLTRTFSLSTKKGKKIWVEPVIDNNKSVSFELHKGKGKPPEPTKVGRGVQFRCLVCGEIAAEEHIKSEGIAGRMHAQLIGIVTEGVGGRNYFAPNSLQEKIAEQAIPDWKPDFEMSTHPQYMAPPRYGMMTFSDLFMPRQLLALETLNNLVDEGKQQAYEDAIHVGFPSDSVHLETGGTGSLAYSEAIGAYLGLTVGRQVNRLSTLCFWDSGSEKVQQVFSRQALTMNWNYVEANPFSNSTGNFLGQLIFPIKMLGNTVTSQPGFADLKDATARKYLKSTMISTDPPYYDNVPYADLSDFFYVWLRPSLRHIYPSIFGTMLVPKDAELVADHQRHGGRDDANVFFEDGMKKVFAKLCNSTNSSYPLTVYYAFRQTESEDTEGTASTGWETMLEGLMHSGYSILATWPVRTEQVTNIKKYRNALASSIVLVCRPRPENAPLTSRREFVNSLRRELPAALRDMQSGNIAPVDLAQASIGPGMAVYSRYSQVLEADGSRLTVRAALQLINQVLDEFLAETEGDLDGDSRFAVSWFEQYGFNSGEFGIADVLARAKNTSVDGLGQAGVIESGAGKVRLFTWEELDPGWDPAADSRPTVWEATHHLIERLNVHGEEGAALLLAKMPPELAADARQLAYRLYAICERKGWADHARDYNALVISWSTSQERAAAVKQSYQQARLFN